MGSRASKLEDVWAMVMRLGWDGMGSVGGIVLSLEEEEGIVTREVHGEEGVSAGEVRVHKDVNNL